MKESFDVIVIGAGPGGYVAAIRASQAGLKTAIIEKQWMGGVCLNAGCIPTKALIKNAEIALTLREKGREFGFSFDNLHLDFRVAVKRSRQISERLARGIDFLMSKNKITKKMGSAKITTTNSVSVTSNNGIIQEFTGKNIIIATGSSPSMIPNLTIDGKRVITYREAIVQEFLPKSIVIVGAGAIGLEFATIWNSYGSKVTMVEMLPRIAPLEDAEVSHELLKAFMKRGINCMVNTTVKKIDITSTGVRVLVSGKDREQTIDADQVLIAIGFKPNSADLGLEELGVELTDRKHIKTDDHMATNIPGIWAIGDVTGKLLLAHVASKQGMVCVEAICNKEEHPIDYLMMPRATYCQPQIASFGLTEEQAVDQGMKIKIGKFPFQANGKALGLSDSSGFAKIITDDCYGEILGVHLIGPEVSELLPEMTLARQNELTVTEIVQNIHAHPTLSEVLMEAAEMVEGNAIHI